jgi:hypothetical protein
MDGLYIDRTDRTPLIEFTDGKLRLWGTFVPENPAEFYLPLNEWVEKYSTNLASETIVEIGIIYTRGSGMNYIEKLLQELIVLNDDHHLVRINWYYGMNTIDSKAGKFLSRKLNYPFNFIDFEGIW